MPDKQYAIFGIDASLSCCGWSLLSLTEDRLIAHGHIRTEKEKKRDNTIERIFTISEELLNAMSREDVKIVAVGIEQLNSVRNMKVVRQLSQLSGAIQARIYDRFHMLTHEVNTKTIKEVFTGLGSAPKSLMVNTANLKYKKDLKSPLVYVEKEKDKLQRSQEDDADAIGVAFTLKHQIGNSLIEALPQSFL